MPIYVHDATAHGGSMNIKIIWSVRRRARSSSGGWEDVINQIGA